MTDRQQPGLIRPDWPAPARVRAVSTTRDGGYSRPPFDSLNLGAHGGDDAGDVRRNRERLAGLLPGEPCWLTQVHGTRVIAWGESGREADAVVSTAAGQVCAVLTADCLPVLFCDRAGSRVGAAHAGWRGLAAGVLEATVKAMDCDPGELLAWLGPAIGPRAYEVGDDVREAFIERHAANAEAFRPSGDRWLADLYELARRALGRAGVSRVFGGTHCTYSDPGRFFSYRRDGQTGRMATLVWLEDSG